MAQGYLQVDVVSDVNSFPVQDADVAIARTEEPDKIIEETRTNSSGQTENLSLDAPPPELSLSPEETERPYAEYTIRITAPGFKPFLVSGTEVLADATAIQGIRLRPLSNAPTGEQTETVTIPDHPEIARIKSMMMENGACGSLMSGSGPTVFGIYKDRELAEKTCQALKEADDGRLTRQVYLTEFYNRKKAR